MNVGARARAPCMLVCEGFMYEANMCLCVCVCVSKHMYRYVGTYIIYAHIIISTYICTHR